MAEILETLLGSSLRTRLLSWLFTHADERYFVREIAARIHADSTNTSRELSRLEEAGIVVSDTRGNHKYYQADAKSPIFTELKSIVRKTFGVAQPELLDIVANRFRIPEDLLAEFCRKHYITRLALFGSVLREDFRPDSDIDVLVEFEPGHVPGFGIIDMQNELSQLVGRRVDLRTPGDLSRYFRDKVVREARVEYAAA